MKRIPSIALAALFAGCDGDTTRALPPDVPTTATPPMPLKPGGKTAEPTQPNSAKLAD